MRGEFQNKKEQLFWFLRPIICIHFIFGNKKSIYQFLHTFNEQFINNEKFYRNASVKVIFKTYLSNSFTFKLLKKRT